MEHSVKGFCGQCPFIYSVNVTEFLLCDKHHADAVDPVINKTNMVPKLVELLG
jgi:hypothetical protein